VTEEAAAGEEAPAGTTLESSPSSTTATGEQALETPEGLDTTNDGAPEAVIPGEGTEAEADAGEEAATEAGAATAGAEATEGTATDAATTGGMDAAVDPGPALRTDVAAAATPDLDALLDPETLDVEAVTAAIEDSDLEAAQQTQLIGALETAQDDPNLLPGVLDRIRTALTGG
jgi:hypothetical protein